jgi:hypothetical protein
MRRVQLFLAAVLFWAVNAAGADELTPTELTAARKMYVAKCAKCHKFYEPRDYSAEEWKRWMEAMSRKSKLKPEQEKLLLRYLDGYRAGRIPKAR